MQTGFMMLRKPMPVARSIHWEPVGWSGPGIRAPVMDVPLFVTQGALREAMRHLRSDPEQELMGFLLGNLFECTNTGSRYVVMTSALRTGHVITEEEPVQIPEEEWLGMQLELRRRRAGLMGWYHSAPFVGPHPVRLDLETHRERFHEPWQTGLVIATAGSEPTGGFFRLTPTDPANGLFIPFDELVDDDGLLPGGRKRTLIDWANYRTEQDVETDRTERRPHLPPRPPAARRTSPASGGTAVDPGAPPPSLPVMLPEPVDLDETPAMPGPEGRRTRLALVGLLLLGAAAGAGGWWWWNQRNGPELPPGVATGLLPSGRVARPTNVPLKQSLDTTGMASRAAGADGAFADSAGSTGVANIPPARSRGTMEGRGGAGGGGTMTDTPGAATLPASAPNTPTPIARPAASTDPLVARFDTMADSLEQAIRNFGNRSSDFAMKRLSCRGLGVGYRGTDDAYISLAARHRDARTSIDAARDARFRRLSSLMDAVNASFDSTKCPRP